MKQFKILLGLLITGTVFANPTSVTDYTLANSTFIESQLELFELEQELFTSLELDETIEVEDIHVYELDETIQLEQDNTTCLQVSEIEIVEIEEEIEIDFDTKKYLPEGFNPYEGMQCEREIVVVSLY